MGVEAPEVRVVPTQMGEFAVVAGPAGVSRVALPGSGATSAPDDLITRLPDGGFDPAEVADEAARQLAGWFTGERRVFTVPVDLGSITGFRRRVLEAAGDIPFGETASYREMAIAAGSPDAVRAAGSAMGANPVPILIPCHRVIRADGSPGMYGGGEKLKRRLLEFEAEAVAATG
ncbi:MAG: methylated-DNA--[protein]-cysteine S-methyltransferase [Solirubrobacterales bacterium]